MGQERDGSHERIETFSINLALLIGKRKDSTGRDRIEQRGDGCVSKSTSVLPFLTLHTD